MNDYDWCATQPDAEALIEACEMAAAHGTVSRATIVGLIAKVRLARTLAAAYEPNSLLLDYLVENFDTLTWRTASGTVIKIVFDAASPLQQRLATLGDTFKVASLNPRSGRAP